MNFDKDKAYIVYASDNKFVEILGISLMSLYDNSREMNRIIVYILDCGISDSNKKKLGEVAESYNRDIPIFIWAKDISRELGMKVDTDRGSMSQYARLFVSSDLPKDLKRVLYLDCDVIINKSIKELWICDLHGKIIAALMDAFSKQYRANIGLEAHDIMFNSGVMLIDLEQWKKKMVEQKLLQFIRTKRGKIQQGDQGALNAVLSKDVHCFEPRFNSITIFYDFTYEDMLIYRKPPEFYSEKQVKTAVEEPNVIHFTTSFLSKRPWVKKCNHKYACKWLDYKSMSPWKDDALWSDSRPIWKQVGLHLYKVLPQRCALHLAGFVQAYVRPMRNGMRNKIK